MEQTIQIKDVNDIFPIIGDGTYEVLAIGMIGLAMLPTSKQTFHMVFLSINPEWVFSGTSNSSSSLDVICGLNSSRWEWKSPIDKTIISKFELYCNKKELIHTTTMLYFVMAAIGSSVIRYFADRFGRKNVLIACLFLHVSIGFLCGFSVSLPMFMALKALTGLFGSPSYSCMTAYTVEIVSEKKRTIGTMIIWAVYPVGNLLLSLTSYFTQNWRQTLLYSTMPYMFIVVILLFLPKSPPWLLQHGNHGELKKIIGTIVRINRRKLSSRLNLAITCDPSKSKKEPKASFCQVFSSVKMVKKTASMAALWFCTAASFAGVSFAANGLIGNLYRDFAILMMVEILAAFLAMYLGSRFGRKKPSFFGLLLGGLSLLIVGFLPHSTKKEAYLLARLGCGILGKLLVTITFLLLGTWTAELYPTFLRSTACGFYLTVAYVGMMCAPWIAVWLTNFHKNLPFYTLGGMDVLASLAAINLGETCGQQLDLNDSGKTRSKETTDEEVFKKELQDIRIFN